MLVLTRKQGESLRIDDDIRITLVSCSKGHARIAIDAPEHVEILREEVYDRIVSANMAAADSQGSVLNSVVKRIRTGAGTRRSGQDG